MQKHIIYFFWLLFPFGVLAQTEPTIVKYTVEQYIEKYSAIAVDEMYRSRIPASITLAQGILESGNGNSRLSKDANNHFGIKCKSTWKGQTIYEDDDAPQECFRKYDAAIDSYRDHSDFLMNNARYAFLFDLEPTDYKSWAAGLKRAGYATNPQYAELLITFIERHQLHRFDLVKLSEEEDRELKEEKAEQIKSYGKEFTNNGVPAIIAKPSDSYAQIALDYGLKVYQIYRNNDLTKDATCKGGDTIYLKQKKSKTDSLYYLVQGNETMLWISQRYAIKLDKLLEKNLMVLGDEPMTGEQIFLSKKREKAPALRSGVVALPVNSTAPAVVMVDSAKTDTVYSNVVYENAEKNLETQKPIDQKLEADSLHVFKENLSFFHTVQKGETLFGISRKYGVRVDAIKYLNLLKNDSIEIGQRLIINPAIRSADTKEPQVVPGVHVVREAETLYGIAVQYGLPIADLKATNNLTSDIIYTGMQLVVVPVAAAGEVKTSDKTGSEEVYHLILKGETLYSISRKYGVSVEKIKDLNYPLSNALTSGQKIRVR
jgi:LysM repeat protein